MQNRAPVSELINKRDVSWHILRMPKLNIHSVKRNDFWANRGEFILADLLKSFGYEAYAPFREEYRHRNRCDRAKRKPKKCFRFPLMVGYLFVGIPPDRYLWSRFFALGLGERLMGRHSQPYYFDHDFMGRFMKTHGPSYDPNRDKEAIHAAPEYHKYMQTFGEFEAGDWVKVFGGSLDGWEVKVQEIMDTKARIVFDMFGKEQIQTIPLDMLIRADAA